MSKNFSIPMVEHHIDFLGNIGYRSQTMDYTYDTKTYELLEKTFELLKKVSPKDKYGNKELWFYANRGPIEDFGDFEELKDWGEVETYEEFEKLWLDSFPEETRWYNFMAIDDIDINYRAIFVGNRFVIELDPRKTTKSLEHNISDFAEWIYEQTKECIADLENGTYNDRINKLLPAEHRTGTITFNDYWELYPDRKKEYFEPLTRKDIEEFISLAEKQPISYKEYTKRLKSITANDFYRFCSLGYKANDYEFCDLSPKEQYYKHADGRDDGLSEIDGESVDEFKKWYFDDKRMIGHPWEVCRGGNSTHISLHVICDENGVYLMLSGHSFSRAIETIKFYLALCRADIPVYLDEANNLIERLLGTEKIGIVPTGIFPRYCESHFPGENILVFKNLPYENKDAFAKKCVWQPIPETILQKN